MCKHSAKSGLKFPNLMAVELKACQFLNQAETKMAFELKPIMRNRQLKLRKSGKKGRLTLKKSYHSHDGRNRSSLSARLLAMRIRTKGTLISKNYLRSQKRSKQSESVKQTKPQTRSVSDQPQNLKFASQRKFYPRCQKSDLTSGLSLDSPLKRFKPNQSKRSSIPSRR